MITRFDHVVIGVRDLQTASDAYRKLGFDVRPGGRHTGLGTHNALMRFGLDYLELLANDPESQEEGGINAFLGNAPGRLLGFALASNRLEDEAARPGAGALDYAPGQPFAMHRTRPDGNVLNWRILEAGQRPWGKPWPFLIQWDTPDEQRLVWDGVGQHPNGACAVAGLTVTARDLNAVEQLYRDQFGLTVASHRVELPNFTIELVESGSDTGLVEVRLRVTNLSATRAWFAQHAIQLASDSLDAAVGARLVFVS